MDFQDFQSNPKARFLADFRGSERGEHRNLIKQTNIKHATKRRYPKKTKLSPVEKKEGSEKTEGEGAQRQTEEEDKDGEHEEEHPSKGGCNYNDDDDKEEEEEEEEEEDDDDFIVDDDDDNEDGEEEGDDEDDDEVHDEEALARPSDLRNALRSHRVSRFLQRVSTYLRELFFTRSASRSEAEASHWSRKQVRGHGKTLPPAAPAQLLIANSSYGSPHAAAPRGYVPHLTRAKLVNFDRPKQVEIVDPVHAPSIAEEPTIWRVRRCPGRELGPRSHLPGSNLG
ncbi:hypothetical protein THAOC_14185 [Thalassiosira oceanica]|uniref:Uncharacterized protein n=1 Tax=Thalassiosira oceanica TaxID=159749 RepID=K0SFU5_THAOC|nr:hypothetical protein THAOC_14185 [Thalassiosira oceanica]|eukprot:EJK65018.1 hypothetical protein THAOC_14185 [Thalassiosira oceanica]